MSYGAEHRGRSIAKPGLRRPDPQGRQARRSAVDAADEVRARDQSEDRKGARPQRPAGPPRARRRGDRMRRREVIAGLGAAAAWPIAAGAQQPAAPTIGFLEQPVAGRVGAPSSRRSAKAWPKSASSRGATSRSRSAGRRGAMRAARARGGARRSERRGASGGRGTPSALAAKAATATIPVVFSGAPDPVGFGIVASLSGPAETSPAWRR